MAIELAASLSEIDFFFLHQTLKGKLKFEG